MNKDSITSVKLYIVPAFVLIIIILLVPFVLIPQIESIREKKVIVDGKNDRLEILNKKVEDLNNIDEADEADKLFEMEKIVPSSQQLASMVVGVRNLASQSDLTVTEMELSPGNVATNSATLSASKQEKSKVSESKKQSSDQLLFKLKLRGKKIKDFQKFYNEIEASKRIFGIQTVAFKLDDEDKKIYEYEFEIEAPYKPIKSKGDAIAKPLTLFSSMHQKIYDFVIGFTNYTNVAVQTVKTGVPNPFK